MVPPKNLCSSVWWMKLLYVNNLLLCVAPVQCMGANHACTTILTKFDHFWFQKIRPIVVVPKILKPVCVMSECLCSFLHTVHVCGRSHILRGITTADGSTCFIFIQILQSSHLGLEVVCDPLRMGFVSPRCVSTSPHMENVLKLHHGATIYN